LQKKQYHFFAFKSKIIAHIFPTYHTSTSFNDNSNNDTDQKTDKSFAHAKRTIFLLRMVVPYARATTGMYGRVNSWMSTQLQKLSQIAKKHCNVTTVTTNKPYTKHTGNNRSGRITNQPQPCKITLSTKNEVL
jgi:hypothetical protein